MGVSYVYYFDFLYPFCVDTTILTKRDRIVGRDKKKAVGMLQINGEYPGFLSGQLMASSRR